MAEGAFALYGQARDGRDLPTYSNGEGHGQFGWACFVSRAGAVLVIVEQLLPGSAIFHEDSWCLPFFPFSSFLVR